MARPPLKIAHVTATFPPYRGGTGNVCWHNACELARRGHEVHIFTAAVPDAPAREEKAGLIIHRLFCPVRVGNAPLLPGLIMALRGFDLIHLHYPFFGGEITALVAALYRTPLVITYHQDVFLSGVLGLIEKALRLTVERWSLRGASRLLFTSLDYGKASYVQPLLKGREMRPGELPNGVDTASFAPGAPPLYLRQRHGLAESDKVVLLVAGLDRAHYFKGVEVLLKSLTRLPAEVKAVIVGDGDLRESYAATAQSLGLAGRVIFAGRVSNEELPDYYRLAALTVLPSVTMGEAFGLVLLESLACATPVVASNLPGVRTVIETGEDKDGLLVEPGDPVALAEAIAAILNDENMRQAMGQGGRARVVAHYDWAQIGQKLEAIYREVLAGDWPPPGWEEV